MQQVSAEQIWEAWLLYETPAHWATAKIAAIRVLADHTCYACSRTAAQHLQPRTGWHPLRAAYCRIDNPKEKSVAKRQTTSVYLKKLVEIGVLAKQRVGREKLFIHPKLMQRLQREQNDFEPCR